MINLYLGFFLSFFGHLIVLLMVLIDFSIFFPNKQNYEVIPLGFILEKKEKSHSQVFQEKLFSLKEIEINNPEFTNLISSEENINTNDLLISVKQSLDKLEEEKFKKTIIIIQKKFIELWNKPFILNEDIKVSRLFIFFFRYFLKILKDLISQANELITNSAYKLSAYSSKSLLV